MITRTKIGIISTNWTLVGMLFVIHLVCIPKVYAQSNFTFDGQLSTIFSYSPDNESPVFSGIRYIPKVSYKIPIDSIQFIDFEASANLSAHSYFKADLSEVNLQPYRLWIRYSGKQFEIRAGLQKIDFGSATFLRPLQWFNQIDARDPLQLTNGVYGLLGRYYFLNNANIWAWALYGNDKPRGFDFLETNSKTPEFGTRIQYPTNKGEIALTYHHRKATIENAPFILYKGDLSEHKFGLKRVIVINLKILAI